MEINNELSMILQRNLATSSKALEVSMVKMSMGKQQSAVEDAASFMIAEGMESQRRGSQQAMENTQIGMNMLQTAESGLGSINDNLQRIRELTVQRENGTLGDTERAAIDNEIGALRSEIDRVSESTSFNNIKLLDGSNPDLALQVGPNGEAETNRKNVGDALTGSSTDDLGLTDQTLTLDQIDNAIGNVTKQRSEIGAVHNGLESTVNSLQIKTENLAAAESRLVDTDIAAEASKLAKNGILQNATGSLLAQANQSPAIAATLL